MRRTTIGCCIIFLCLSWQSTGSQSPVQDPMKLRVNVVLVQLNIAVTDSKGNYVTGLRPEDFVITEDKIPQKFSTFEESRESAPGSKEVSRPGQVSASESAHEVAEPAHIDSTADLPSPHLNEASVFVLFDTSNYMYRSFVYAQDAITDFVRSMDEASRIAFYSYCRDLSRPIQLTSDRFRLINGVRSTVAGDDAALYNSLLLTVKDAAPLKGRKAIVVFSNGPDNASSIPPEDVAELAQSTGTIRKILLLLRHLNA
jgi:Ca-activated chloride channel family protein